VNRERGAGLVSAVVGVTAFLALLLFAVQLVLNLYATSVVTAAAFDGARIVAGSAGGSDAEADAEAYVRDLIGARDDLELRWSYGGDTVSLTVETSHPTALLGSMPVPFQRIVRTVEVRREAYR
jgi:hypothetical protein